MTIIERIQKKLDEKKIKPAQMSKDLGFSSGLFSQWKAGLQKPSASKIEKISEYLGCSADYLMGKESDLEVSYPNIKEEDMDMLNSLKSKDREAVRALMKSLLNK